MNTPETDWEARALAAEAEVADLRDVLLRNGFKECDSAACNCGSWHHVYGIAERFSEFHDAFEGAGINLNGKTALTALLETIARAEAAEAELSRLTAPLEGAKTTEEERQLIRRFCSGEDVGPPVELLGRLLNDLTRATAAARTAAREENEACAVLLDENGKRFRASADGAPFASHFGQSTDRIIAVHADDLAAAIRARHPKGE